MPLRKLNLVVVRSSNPPALAEFYGRLGLHFDLHAHGNGPEHYSAEVDGLVFEIYPALAEATATTSVRFGFAVEDLRGLLTKAMDAGAQLRTPPRDTEWGLRAVIVDPAGHHVELTERSPGWRVVRQDDNGNEFLVEARLTLEAATALAKEFEARGHKQLYSVRRETSS